MYQGIGLIMQTALQIGSFHKHIYCSSSHLHLSAWSVSVPCVCTWNLNLIFIYMYDVLYYSWHNILCGVQQYRWSSGYWWQRGTSSNIPAGQSSKFKVKMCLLQNCSRFKKSDGPKVLTIKIWTNIISLICNRDTMTVRTSSFLQGPLGENRFRELYFHRHMNFYNG